MSVADRAAGFKCPKCNGTDASIMAFPDPLIIHWLVNPGLVINELVLGQCVPRQTFCNSCPPPKMANAYLGCLRCGTYHSGSLWSNRRAFGQWLGYACPNCGAQIPRLWNLWSLAIIGLLAPLWWWPVRRYRGVWLEWQRQRLLGAEPVDVHARLAQFRWFRFGVLYWGLPLGLAFSFAMPLILPGMCYWCGVAWSLLFLPVWLMGGVLFALLSRTIIMKWGAS